MEQPRLYDDLADWFHLLTAPEDYAEEAAVYREMIEASAHRPVVEVLELGSGGGNNASHLAAHWKLTLVDRSAAMLDQSRRLLPDLPHIVGDMRTVRLGRDFDAVFVHDACSYLTEDADLGALARTCATHLRPGGVALLCPDQTAETFVPGTDSGGRDGPDRSLRYFQWDWDPDPTDHLVRADFVYMLREGASMRVVQDIHIESAFPQAMWLEALEEAGLRATVLPFVHSEVEHPMVVFVGVQEGRG